MVSSIHNSDSNSMQALMQELFQKMNTTNATGAKGVTQDDLSSIGSSSSSQGSSFLDSLNDQFAQLDTDGDGSLSQGEYASGVISGKVQLSSNTSNSTSSSGQAGSVGGGGGGGPIQDSTTSTTTTTSSTSTSDSSSTNDTIGDIVEQLMKKMIENFAEKLDQDSTSQQSDSTQDSSKASAVSNSNAGQSTSDIMNSLSSADTDSVDGLSKVELSSIDASNNSKEANLVKELQKDFDKIDTDGNGELSTNEIKDSKLSTVQDQLHYLDNNANSLGQSFGKTLSSISSELTQKILNNYQNLNGSGFSLSSLA